MSNIVAEANVAENTVSDREMTKEEIAKDLENQQFWLNEQAALEAAAAQNAEAKASAESKLAALGLTAEEIAALRG